MFKKVIVFLSDYPYGMGEPFFEKELKELVRVFGEVLLINTSKDVLMSNNQLFDLPLNARVVNLFPDKVLKVSYFKSLFRFRFYKELFKAVFKFKTPISKGLVYDIFYYTEQSVNYSYKISSFLKKNKVETNETLFYAYWSDFYAVSLSYLRNKEKILFFVTKTHGWDLYFERHDTLFLPYRDYVFNSSDRVFSISQKGENYIIDRKLIKDNSKISVSYLGVYYNYQFEEYKDSNCLKILSISHINGVKRLDRIVNAIKDIKEFEIVWTHVGYGEDKFEQKFINWALNEIKFNDNIKIDFKGFKNKNEIEEILRSKEFSVFVNSSESEGIPVSIMEAICFGYPVIAYDVGGISEIVESNMNGILIEGDDDGMEVLKKALIYFYNLTFEEKNKLSLGAHKLWNEKFNSKNNFELFAKKILSGK